MNKIEYLETHLELTLSPMDYMGHIKNNPESCTLVDVRNAPPHLKKENLLLTGSLLSITWRKVGRIITGLVFL